MRRFLLCLFCVLAPVAARADDAIGRVNTGGFNSRGMCTGALVAPDKVLTAAHCVKNPTTFAETRASDLIFVAGWDGERHAAAARVAEFTIHPLAFGQGQLDPANDVAVLTLRAPLDIAPLPLGQAAPVGPLSLEGYKRSKPHRLDVQPDCVGLPRGGLWQIACPAESGMSGGPVLAGEADTRRIVATMVAAQRGFTFAVPVGDWVRAEVLGE